MGTSGAELRERIRFWLDIVTSVVAVAGIVAVVYFLVGLRSGTPPPPPPQGRGQIPIPVDPVSLDGAVFKGSASAPVVILEFSEFFCPFCRRFATETLPQLEQQIVRGEVALAFRHLPLDALHPFARRAAELAVCAGQEGRFWEAHDAIFAKPWERTDGAAEVRARVLSAGVDGTALDRCQAQPQAAARVAQDVEQAAALQVRSTPAFMIGTRDVNGRLRVHTVIEGSRPLEEFLAAIKESQESQR